MPVPKWCCQRRFTITRAVSGLSFEAIQFARAARRPGVVARRPDVASLRVDRLRGTRGEFVPRGVPPVAALQQPRRRRGRAGRSSPSPPAGRPACPSQAPQLRLAGDRTPPSPPPFNLASTRRLVGVDLLGDHRPDLLLERRELLRRRRRAGPRTPSGTASAAACSPSCGAAPRACDRGPHLGGLRLPRRAGLLVFGQPGGRSASGTSTGRIPAKNAWMR